MLLDPATLPFSAAAVSIVSALATPLAAAGLSLTRRFYLGSYLRAGEERPEPTAPTGSTPIRRDEGGRR